MIYDNFKNVYESLETTSLFAMNVYTCKLTKQNWKFFLLFLVNCETRFPLKDLITIF
jgi:hypothetical protein